MTARRLWDAACRVEDLLLSGAEAEVDRWTWRTAVGLSVAYVVVIGVLFFGVEVLL